MCAAFVGRGDPCVEGRTHARALEARAQQRVYADVRLRERLMQAVFCRRRQDERVRGVFEDAFRGLGGIARRLGGDAVGRCVAHHNDALAAFGQVARGNPSVAAVVSVAAQHDEAGAFLRGDVLLAMQVLFGEGALPALLRLLVSLGLFRHAPRPVGEEAPGAFHEQREGGAALRYLLLEAHHVGYVQDGHAFSIRHIRGERAAICLRKLRQRCLGIGGAGGGKRDGGHAEVVLAEPRVQLTRLRARAEHGLDVRRFEYAF